MQDRYKFRGLKNGKWFYGGYFKHLPYTPYCCGKEPPEKDYKHLIIQEDFSDWGLPRGIKYVEVDGDTVGQCTGLRDKNGNLVCEGDILFEKCINVIYPNGKFWVVKWNDKHAEFYIDLINPVITAYSTNKWHLARHDLDYEVVGNIYENPELLEVDNDFKM